VTGVSGSGKSSVIRELLKTHHFTRLVTNTTRAPRENDGKMEVDGKDYYFRTLSEMRKMLEKKEFLEVKLVYGNLYGTSVDELLRLKKSGQTVLVSLDIQGCREYQKINPKLRIFLITPPSEKVLVERLHHRGAETDRELHQRLKRARQEEKAAAKLKNVTKIINDELDLAVEQVLANLS
jgi:guanylate kinase